MAQSRNTEVGYLRGEQYGDDRNLQARIALHRRFSRNAYGWQPWLFDQLDLPPQAQVLELGCGPGTLWVTNRDRIGRDWRVTLADFSPGMVTAARAWAGADRRFRFEVADAQAIPHQGGFDAVLANHMLYHVPDRGRALAEIRRVLRPGGRLYAATNGIAHLREIDELVHAFAPTADPDDSATRFGLENGPAQVAQHFAAVEVRRYEDGLAVTESAALLDYVLSTAARPQLTGAVVSGLRAEIERTIKNAGAFRITKDAGVVIGTAP